LHCLVTVAIDHGPLVVDRFGVPAAVIRLEKTAVLAVFIKEITA